MLECVEMSQWGGLSAMLSGLFGNIGFQQHSLSWVEPASGPLVCPATARNTE